MAAEKSKDPAMYVKRDGVLWLAGWLATKQTALLRGWIWAFLYVCSSMRLRESSHHHHRHNDDTAML